MLPKAEYLIVLDSKKRELSPIYIKSRIGNFMEIRRVELLASAVQKQRSTSELYPPWAILDLNQRLLSYQDSALTTELIALLEKYFMEQLDNVNFLDWGFALSPFAEGEAPVQKNRMLSRRSRPFLAPLAKLGSAKRIACHRLHLHQRLGHFSAFGSKRTVPAVGGEAADGRPLDPWSAKRTVGRSRSVRSTRAQTVRSREGQGPSRGANG